MRAACDDDDDDDTPFGPSGAQACRGGLLLITYSLSCTGDRRGMPFSDRPLTVRRYSRERGTKPD